MAAIEKMVQAIAIRTATESSRQQVSGAAVTGVSQGFLDGYLRVKLVDGSLLKCRYISNAAAPVGAIVSVTRTKYGIPFAKAQVRDGN